MATPDSTAMASDLARYIDHTLLSPTATESDVLRVCDEALRYGFRTVCVNGCHVALAARRLGSTPLLSSTATSTGDGGDDGTSAGDGRPSGSGAGSGPEERRGGPVPIAVVGFPLGAASTSSKAAEARLAVCDGAAEIDMVLNIGWLLSSTPESDARVVEDVRAVVDASRPAIVKVIIETCLLPDDATKVRACRLAVEGGAGFVKTSTGFGTPRAGVATNGATEHDVRLMREVVGETIGVKASGGIRTFDDAQKMIAAGASRLGCSAGVAIVSGTAAAPSTTY